MLWLVDAALLAIVMVVCFAGIFVPKTIFDDTLLERLGMTGLFLFCWPRLNQLLALREMTGNCIPISAQLFGHAGLALLALCASWRVWRNRRAQAPAGWPKQLSGR